LIVKTVTYGKGKIAPVLNYLGITP
jgi:hypothetical protein